MAHLVMTRLDRAIGGSTMETAMTRSSLVEPGHDEMGHVMARKSARRQLQIIQ